MALYERILRLEDPKIPVHAFMAALAEVKRGQATRAQLINLFNLDSAAQADLNALADRFNDAINPLTGTELHDVLLLAESGLAYKTVNALKNRLGV